MSSSSYTSQITLDGYEDTVLDTLLDVLKQNYRSVKKNKKTNLVSAKTRIFKRGPKQKVFIGVVSSQAGKTTLEIKSSLYLSFLNLLSLELAFYEAIDFKKEQAKKNVENIFDLLQQHQKNK